MTRTTVALSLTAWAALTAGCAPPPGSPAPAPTAATAPASPPPVAAAEPPPRSTAPDDRRADANDIDNLIRDLGGKTPDEAKPKTEHEPAKEQPKPGDPDDIDALIKKHTGKASAPGKPKEHPGQETVRHGPADVVAWVKRLGGEVQVDAEQPGRPVVGVDLDETRVTDNDLVRLQGLPRLRALSLNSTNIGDAGLKNLRGLTSLEELALSATDVTDAGLAHLRGLSNLRTLDLDASRGVAAIQSAVSGSGPARPGRVGKPRLRITNAGLADIQGLTNLVNLDLTGNAITGSGLARLAGLDSLRELNLSETEVGNAGLVHLGRFGKLETLDLSTTAVTDAGLAYLRALPRLKELGVLETKVTPAGLARNGLTRAARAFEDKGGAVIAGDFLNSDPPPAKGGPSPQPRRPVLPAGVQLPPYFDKLGLTDDQVEKMGRVARSYDDRIAELTRKLDRARGVPVGMTGVIVGLVNAIKKLKNQRQQALADLLTDGQRGKLKALRAGK
jgi:hypothetical protein